MQKWQNANNEFDLVTEINGWINANNTLLCELHKLNDKCFNGNGTTAIRDRRRYNSTGYVYNQSETTLYKLEIIRTK